MAEHVRQLCMGGDHPRRRPKADPDPFFVSIGEFGLHDSEYVIAVARVDETEETPGHTSTEEKLDRIVEVGAASEDDRGRVRVALHLVEPGGAEQRRDLGRLRKREHAWSPRQPTELWKLDVSADRIADHHQPLVRAKTLPTGEGGTAAGAERASDVGERLHRVVEEHQSELADQ